MYKKAQEKSLELNKVFVEETSQEDLESIMREFDKFECIKFHIGTLDQVHKVNNNREFYV